MIAQEPCSWELLDYWRAQPGELAPTWLWPRPMLVYRREGTIRGFAGVWSNEGVPQLGLFADAPLIAYKLLAAADEALRAMGIPGYLVIARRPEGARVMRKLPLFTELFAANSGPPAFARIFGNEASLS